MEAPDTDLDLSLVTALYRTTNAVVREMDQRLGREHNVTFIQAVTLVAVDSFEQAQPHLVADFLSQQSQTVTGVLDRLERAGLLVRKRDLEDRRAVRLELTDSGSKLAEALRASLAKDITAIVAGVGEGSRSQLASLLGDLEASVAACATTGK
ncbi:MAG: MarR family winged helix-turn-helix transcriptional regulator [Dehalococcoidia bacterium]